MFDPITASIAVGLVVSLLFSELFGLAAGGMVVPGYFALSLDQPADVLLTLAIALTTFFVVRGISQLAIVYGRRRTVLMILFGFLLGALVRAAPLPAAETMATIGTAGGFDLHVIGFIIPGLIAIWIDRQGVVETLSVLMTSAVVVRLVLILVGMEVPA